MWVTNAEQTAVWKKLEDGTYVYEHSVMEDRVWSLGLGPMCCLSHHCPMTIYGGCPECNKQILKNMGEKC